MSSNHYGEDTTATCAGCGIVYNDQAALLEHANERHTATPACKLPALVAEYAKARETFENAQLGPRTDRAEARMEATLAKAEKLGLAAELTKALGY